MLHHTHVYVNAYALALGVCMHRYPWCMCMHRVLEHVRPCGACTIAAFAPVLWCVFIYHDFVSYHDLVT